MISGAYDIVTVGGGLGGAALAKAMAESGARVLVLEQETRFRDRVRGEAMMPWGVAEARELGIYDTIMASGGHELKWWDSYQGSDRSGHRDLVKSTVSGEPVVSFYHPPMQEGLVEAALGAGVEVHRGARVRDLETGDPLSVVAEIDGRETKIRARLVVGADGRNSLMRRLGGFDVRVDADHTMVAGVLLDDVPTSDDATHLWLNPELGLFVLIFPQGNGRARAYVCYPAGTGENLSGERMITRFAEQATNAGAPAENYAKARVSGPLVTFNGALARVEHAYHNGVALIGDAAAATDPTWGQGLSLTVRDARVLRDHLLQHEDWNEAGHAYAREHNVYCDVVHTFENWTTQVLLDTGPESEARRARAFSSWQRDRNSHPDMLLNGPHKTLDEAARKRFFGEE